MISDSSRFNAYAGAVLGSASWRRCVEIGCGPAVFALLAWRADGRHFYAIGTENIVAVARNIAAEK